MEEENPLEAKEKLDELSEHRSGWTKYLAITTAVIAVLAAVASMRSGNLANTALLLKNDAIIAQTKASDQWSFYQAKGIKKALAETMATIPGKQGLRSKATREGTEQVEIQAKARSLEEESERDNAHSESFLQRHERAATSVTMLQIAIALSAMAALMNRRWFWFLSLGLSAVGAFFLATSFG